MLQTAPKNDYVVSSLADARLFIARSQLKTRIEVLLTNTVHVYTKLEETKHVASPPTSPHLPIGIVVEPGLLRKAWFHEANLPSAV